MAVAINNSCLALELIPEMQQGLDNAVGGGRHLQIHRICVYATILPTDSELWRQLPTSLDLGPSHHRWLAKQEALDWQADPDNDLDELDVLHHLRQQAASVPILSSVIFTRDHSNAATTLSGSAMSPSIKVAMHGRLLSSFQGYSFRQSSLHLPRTRMSFEGISRKPAWVGHFGQHADLHPYMSISSLLDHLRPKLIVDCSDIHLGNIPLDYHCMLWQVQVDVVDLLTQRTHPTSHPGRRRRTAFNPFLQVSDSPVIEVTVRGDRLQKYNGVRHRPDRKIWVAEMKPHKHMNKQDFGNFKSEAEAARAVDAAFHYYGKPHLLNFPGTALQFLSTRPAAAPGLDEKAKVKFVKEEAKLLLAAIAGTSSHHSTQSNSLPSQIPELSASPFKYSGPIDADAAISQPQQWVNLDSTCGICTTGGLSNLETLNPVQNAEQGWNCSGDSSTLAVPSNVVNSSACEIQSMWLDSLIRSPPPPTYSRSPSPSHFQEEIAHALLEQQASGQDPMTLYINEDSISSTNFENM